MSKTMKALVKTKAEKGLWMQDVTIPNIAPNEVLIKIERTAICGTDMHIYKWDEWAQQNVPVPLVVGHEYGGVVETVGSTVTRVKVGQKVTGEGHVVGRRSRNARAGKFHLDPEGFDVGLEMSGAEPAFNQMLDVMLMGGNIAMLGIPVKPFPVDFGKVVGKALTLRGIYGRQMYETWYKMLALLDSGLDMSPMITHHFAASDFQDAFDLMETGKTGKVILDWTKV